jgi:hypothetical protein
MAAAGRLDRFLAQLHTDVVDGDEGVRALMGVDSNNRGIVNTYLSASDASA